MLPHNKIIDIASPHSELQGDKHDDVLSNNGATNNTIQAQHQKHLKHTAFIYLMSLNACLGSFFFGYNLGVYNTTQKVIQTLNHWSDSENTNYTSIITAAMPFGAFIAALFSKSLIGALKGIRKSMILFDIIGIIGTIIIICQHDMSNLIIGRIISGFCIGMNTSLVPEYIRDFSPSEIRSRVGSLNQSLLTLGVFVSYLMSLVLPLPSDLKADPNGNYDVNWRFVLGIPIATCTIRLLLLIFKFTHETPTIMILQHRYQEVKDYLQMVYDDDQDIKQAYSEMCEIAGVDTVQEQEALDQQNGQASINGNFNDSAKDKKISHEKLGEVNEHDEKKMNKAHHKKTDSNFQLQHPTSIDIAVISEEHIQQEKLIELLDKSTYSKRLILGCIIQYATQCTGVNALLFYSNVIFNETTGSELTSRVCTIFLGLSMAVYSLISMVIITKFGRKSIMTWSTLLTVVMLILFALLQEITQTNGTQITGIIFIFIYMFGWQAGLGTTTWVYNNEILDRKGLSIASFIRWLFTMLVGVVFPYMNQSIKLFGSFIVFGILSLMCVVYFWIYMNETRGKTRLDMMKSFTTKANVDRFQRESVEFAKQKVNQSHKNGDEEYHL